MLKPLATTGYRNGTKFLSLSNVLAYFAQGKQQMKMFYNVDYRRLHSGPNHRPDRYTTGYRVRTPCWIAPSGKSLRNYNETMFLGLNQVYCY